jgi:hypothetical protein
MALDIDDPETEEIVHRLARLTGLSTDEAIKRAAQEQLRRLDADEAAARDRTASRTR